MNEGTPEHSLGFGRLRRAFGNVVEAIAAYAKDKIPRPTEDLATTTNS